MHTYKRGTDQRIVLNPGRMGNAALRTCLRKHGIRGILSDSSDWGVATAAHVADALGLPGIGGTAARNCTDKSKMRAAVSQAGLPSPASALIGSVDELDLKVRPIGLPLIIKPVDNQSGHGVSRIDAWTDLPAAYLAALAASRRGLVQAEQCLEGIEIIVDGIVSDGRCWVLSVAAKTPYTDNPTVASRILYPELHELPAPIEEIQQTSRRTVAALGLNNGLFHAEFIASAGLLHPIDVAARGGGVHIYRQVVPHVSGVNLNRAAILQAMGIPLSIKPHTRQRCANIEFFRLPPGEVLSVHGVSDALAVADIVAVHINVGAGDLVGPLHNKDRRPGYIVSLGDTSSQVIAAAGRAKSLLRFTMSSTTGEISAH